MTRMEGIVKQVNFKKIGQKKKTPEKTDSLRKFYSSLYKQNPNSEMATKWLIEHGCFGPKKTEKVLLIMSMRNMAIK